MGEIFKIADRNKTPNNFIIEDRSKIKAGLMAHTLLSCLFFCPCLNHYRFIAATVPKCRIDKNKILLSFNTNAH